MSYDVKKLADKLIYMASLDEANGGELLTNLKLQKLLYYEQGYHLAIFDTPLFDDNIEAWMYGPVVPNVYDSFSEYHSQVLPLPKDEIITLEEKDETLFAQVYEALREFSAIGLANKTHAETPWIKSLPHNRGTVIPQNLIKQFFKQNMTTNV